jgi:methylthioribose-1-phosphate isomerase
MKKTDYFSAKFENDEFIFLDQTKLPLEEVYVRTDDYERIAIAIERLEVRGAPLIGIAAAYALALSLKKSLNGNNNDVAFSHAYDRLARTRPTAVNLFFALDLIKSVYETQKNSDNIYQTLLAKAVQIHNEDIQHCKKIGDNGLRIFQKKSNVLTHCNTGKLATGGAGTAFSVIQTGFEKGLVNYVYADETRPLFQGLRLTAFELEHSGIPFSVLSDSMAASLMKDHKVDLVITGADRIALNGDAANKIGTYSLAILCNYHDIPFYIAAPSTSIDRSILTGEDIKIEFRDKKEILNPSGHQLAPDHYDVYSPAFDVTPSHLIKGIITEEDIFFFPYNFLK